MPLSFFDHHALTGEDNHSIFRWVWANNAAYAAQSVVAEDVGKVGWQQDNNTFWVLINHSPKTRTLLGGSSGSADLTAFTPAGGISSENVQDALEELDAEKQPLDAELTALASVTSNTNKLPYFTGIETAGVCDLSSFGRTLIDDGDAATARATLGLGTASTKDSGAANGVATLDSGGKVPTSELPAAILGQVSYQGAWNASTNSPALTDPTDSTTKGYYYVVSAAGTRFSLDFQIGDWVISNGTNWQKVDNTDAVTSVFGRTGAVVLTSSEADGTTIEVSSNAVRVKDAGITATKLAAALKPSGTAAAGDEALRALGTTASTACAGNDSRLSDTRTPTDNTVSPAKLTTASKVFTVNVCFPEINAGDQVFFRIHGDHTWTGVSILAAESGSVVFDIWKDTHTNAPPTVADSICASAKPTLSSAQKANDTTLTGWTTSGTDGDWYVINVDSMTGLTNVTLALKGVKA